jgi:hypothetical protein
MWCCGRRRGGVRFWLLRFRDAGKGTKRGRGAGSRGARWDARPYIWPPFMAAINAHHLLRVGEALGGFLGCGVDFY